MVIAGARRAASKFRPVRAFSPLGLRIRDEGVPSSRIPSPEPSGSPGPGGPSGKASREFA